jgi:hypothetical protein
MRLLSITQEMSLTTLNTWRYRGHFEPGEEVWALLFQSPGALDRIIWDDRLPEAVQVGLANLSATRHANL